ncbi:hypothetical protein BGZ60DRAFT_398191 [Tricladium varicosporioides]|nr:hypothetical protein BGZ60DRAFT_398191 [Hymenoscyphus varicosporioides]
MCGLSHQNPTQPHPHRHVVQETPVAHLSSNRTPAPRSLSTCIRAISTYLRYLGIADHAKLTPTNETRRSHEVFPSPPIPSLISSQSLHAT